MFRNRDITLAFWAGAAVFASRLPFLNRSYGYDGDAWNVAYASGWICTEHQYVWSRPPCYPLHEIVCALFWKGGPLLLNGLTAIFSAVAAALFFAILRSLGIRRADAVVGAVTLACVPVFYVNSTVTPGLHLGPDRHSRFVMGLSAGPGGMGRRRIGCRDRLPNHLRCYAVSASLDPRGRTR